MSACAKRFVQFVLFEDFSCKTCPYIYEFYIILSESESVYVHICDLEGKKIMGRWYPLNFLLSLATQISELKEKPVLFMPKRMQEILQS